MTFYDKLSSSAFFSPKALLLASLILVLGFGQVVERIKSGPTGCHAWRQADGASITRQFSQSDNYSLFQPKAYNLAGKEGRMATELPVTYWLAGQWSRVFGYSRAWLKVLHFSIFIIGIYFFYLFCKLLIGNAYLALLPPIFVITSPLLVYYGNNTLPNVPALGFVLIAWWSFWKYLKGDGSYRPLWIAAITLSIGILLKASEAIHLVAMISTLIIGHLFFYKGISFQWSTRRGVTYILWFAAISIPFVLWLMYANNYNELYGNKMNLSGILPIWEMDEVEKAASWRGLTVRFFKRMMHRPLWWVFAAMLISFILNPKTYKSLFNWSVFILLLGSWMYILLFYKVFYSHDYYLVTGLPALMFFTVAWLKLYSIWLTSQKVRWITLTFCIGLFAYSLSYLDQEITTYYSYPDVNPALYDFEPALREMGVGRDQKILAIPDYSPNISLFYSNNIGHTDYFYSSRKSGDLNYLYNQGVRYLVAIDPQVINDDMRTRLGPILGVHRGIEVYPILSE